MYTNLYQESHSDIDVPKKGKNHMHKIVTWVIHNIKKLQTT